MENYKKILIAINPILPHFSNECLEMIGGEQVMEWPSYNEEIIKENEAIIVLQINGKKRGIINTKKDLNENEIFNEIKKDDKLSKYIDENKIKKRIYIKNKIMNLIL
tara:strand:- start:73 stop:393 length:321 start_codon:yes stop_codon:yes gene_type:complete